MRKPVHPFAQKYSASRLPQIKLTVCAVPAHKRGVSRSSRTLGRGCDGRTSPSAIIARRTVVVRTASLLHPRTPVVMGPGVRRDDDDGSAELSLALRNISLLAK